MRERVTWKFLPVLVLLITVGIADHALASGSYTGRPPRPPSSVDRGLYEMGKKVFAGEFVVASAPGSAASQSELLSGLHERLPHKARAKSEIASYAGQLSAEQVKALQYFLKKRYKIR
jgi:hypothetical protein